MTEASAQIDAAALGGHSDEDMTRSTFALYTAANWFRDLADQILRVDPSLLRQSGFTPEDVPVLRLNHAVLQKWSEYFERMETVDSKGVQHAA